jgi:hypothetical protein
MFPQLMPNPTQLHAVEITLRDGSQPEGLNNDKLTIAAMRRRMGVGYIEVSSSAISLLANRAGTSSSRREPAEMSTTTALDTIVGQGSSRISTIGIIAPIACPSRAPEVSLRGPFAPSASDNQRQRQGKRRKPA